ncbi:MAG: DUF4153 domain-containing protein [bacterium]|nr:DUF4153 domain-containing protein [bacterium]
MRLPSLNAMLAHALRTVHRFPAEILVAVVGTIAAMTLVYLEDVYTLPHEQSQLYAHIILSSILALSTALCLTIAFESGRISAWLRWTLLVVLVGALTWFVFGLTTASWDLSLYAAAALAVHMGVALSGTWNRSRRSFWEFNKTLFLRTLTGALFTGVLMCGISLAILALDTLFNVEVKSWMYGWECFFLIGVFNTLFVLGGIPETPKTYDAEAAVTVDESAAYPRGLRVFTQFVLLPLVVVFLCILYAYGVKVLFFAALEGGVSAFVLWLSVAGILAYLLVYPLRHETEHAWISLYARWFGRFMVPLSAMLWVAIIVRVNAYGITEERYAVIALACVLTLVSVYLAFKRDPDLRVIPALLLAASVVAFVGPFNMANVSYNSQTSRANTVLQAYGVLGNGTYNKEAAKKIPNAEAEIVRSVVHYLSAYRDSSRLEKWLISLPLTAQSGLSPDSVVALLGVTQPADSRKSFYVNIDHVLSPMVNWVNDGSVQPFSLHHDVSDKYSEAVTFFEGGAWNVTFPVSRQLLWIVTDPAGNQDTLWFRDELVKNTRENSSGQPRGSFVQTAEFPTKRVRFIFTQLNASANDSTWESIDAEGMVIVERK